MFGFFGMLGDQNQPLLCVLASNSDEPMCVKLVEALCAEHQINLIQVDDKKLGEWVGGLCKIDREGKPCKVIGCNSVVVKDYGKESQAKDVIKEYFKHKKWTNLWLTNPTNFWMKSTYMMWHTFLSDMDFEILSIKATRWDWQVWFWACTCFVFWYLQIRVTQCRLLTFWPWQAVWSLGARCAHPQRCPCVTQQRLPQR